MRKHRNIRTILFVAANGSKKSVRRLAEERTVINDIFKNSKNTPAYELVSEFVVTEDNFPQHLRTYAPWFLHFAGHGIKSGGILLEGKSKNGKGKIIDTDLLLKHIKGCASIKGVFFNCCYSGLFAAELLKKVNYFIGVSEKIPDSQSIKFAQTFYSAFVDFNSVGLAMMHLYKDLATQKQLNFFPVIEFKNKNEMNTSDLAVQIENKKKQILSKRDGISDLQNELAGLETQLRDLSNQGASHLDGLLVRHPFRKVADWFLVERESLCRLLASRTLGDTASDKKIAWLTDELEILFEPLESALVNFDLRELSGERIKNLFDWSFPSDTYRTAISELPNLAHPAIFSEEEIEFIEDITAYFCDLI